MVSPSIVGLVTAFAMSILFTENQTKLSKIEKTVVRFSCYCLSGNMHCSENVCRCNVVENYSFLGFYFRAVFLLALFSCCEDQVDDPVDAFAKQHNESRNCTSLIQQYAANRYSSGVITSGAAREG